MAETATIFALSSGPPPAAIAIIRVSGPGAAQAIRELTQRPPPQARRMSQRKLFDPVSAEMLDDALVVWLPGPKSVTGEDMVELHVHGSRAVVDGVLAALGGVDGLSPANHGAFTRQAFANGRMDLSQIEGLADLIAAETAEQRRSALLMSEGALGRAVENWRTALLLLAARVEAALDFADEDDVVAQPDLSALPALLCEARTWLERPSAERLRDGVRVVLAGPPNAGKSTLLNALIGRNAAIISPQAGTTRDVIEAPVAIDGIPFVIIDTAGLHKHAANPIEQEGIARAREHLERADLILWLGSDAPPPADCPCLRIAAKSDLVEVVPGNRLLPDSALLVSALTGAGMDVLREAILAEARKLIPAPSTTAINARQRGLIGAFSEALSEAEAAADLLIVAEHLRTARLCLDRLVGRAGVEDMLDALFGSLCIGK